MNQWSLRVLLNHKKFTTRKCLNYAVLELQSFLKQIFRNFWTWEAVLFYTIQTSSLEDQRAHRVTASFFGILHLRYIRDQTWTASTAHRINHLHLFLTPFAHITVWRAIKQNQFQRKLLARQSDFLFHLQTYQVAWGSMCVRNRYQVPKILTVSSIHSCLDTTLD